MSNLEKFWDKRANSFEKKPIRDEKSFLETIEKVKRHLSKTNTILDYACGTGTFSNKIADCVNDVHAIDISSNMIAFAIEKAAAQNITNIKHYKSTLFDDSLDKVKFDAVLAFNILHLSEDMEEVIQRIKQILKPGGLLISLTPCLNKRLSLMGIVESVLRKFNIVPNLNMPSFVELKTAITNGHFEIIEVEEPGPKSPKCFLVAKSNEVNN